MELGDLNPEQRQAVTHANGPMLVIAGAGTGKTQVITRRIAYLILEKKIEPGSILALTFTDKAAREMEERVDQLLPLGLTGTQIMTFNSFGDKVLREFGMDIGLQPSPRLITRTQQIVLLRDHIDDLGLEYFASKGNPSSLFGEWLNYFSSLRNELITPVQYQEYAAMVSGKAENAGEKLEAQKHTELARAYQVYSSIKQAKGLIDYDDQVSLVIELLESRPNVAEELQKRFRYILVDEFQDTNAAQDKLLELLATQTGNVTVVGDDDQSIYKFRGAAISNILAFNERYKGVTQVVLTENYRSTQEILDASYSLIQNNNPYRLEEKYGIEKRLKSTRKGDDPRILLEPDIHTEADMVARAIAEEIKKGTDPAEIAVLTRKNKQLEIISNALQRQGVPYKLNTSQKLFQQSEIQLLLCFLQFMADPHDSTALFNLLEQSIYRLDTLELARVSSKSRSLNEHLDSYLRENNSTDQAFNHQVQDILKEMDRLRSYSTQHSVAELAYEFLVSSGYIALLEDRAETDPRVAGQFKNLEQFLQSLVEFQDISEDPTVRGYIRSLGNIRELWHADSYQDSDFSSGEVKLMTVHQAKGLEFESVYIFDVNHTDFPGINRQNGLKVPEELIKNETLPEGDWHIQEERRLMYVAMTRAKKRLVTSFSPDHGGKQLRKPSMFLKEIFGKELGESSSKPQQLSIPLQRFAPSAQGETRLQDQLLDDRGRLRLTPHHIDDYLTCPYNFRYRYLLHVPEAPNPALMYGNLIHQVINTYFLRRSRGDVKLADLTSMIEELWSGEGFDSKKQEEQRKSQAHEAIKRFYQKQEAEGILPKLTEEKLEFEVPAANALVRGRFDAVFEYADGSVEIRDYKTSFVETSEKAEDKAKKSVQLAIYALAWRYRTGKSPDRVALDYVNTGQIGAAVKTPKQLELIEQKIIKVAEGIRAGEFPPQGDHRYCSHRPINSDEKATIYAG